MRGGTTQGAEASQGSKRRPWMRLEVSGGGILVIGGVIIAAALAARRGHVNNNKQRNKRKTTTPGSGYEQYHKEKEEEVKDDSIKTGCGEITAAEDLVEIKKDGSMIEVDEKLGSCQSHKEEAETVVGLKANGRVKKQDDRQEVGEEKDEEMKKEKEDDACAGVGEGEGDQISVNGHGQEEDQLSGEMLFIHARNQIVIHVEDDDTKQVVDEEEQMELCGEETELAVEEFGKGEEGFHFQPNETNEEERELSSSSTYVVLKDIVKEGECDCREEGCNTESYEEETEPLDEKREVQPNETNGNEGGSFFNDALTKDEEPDAEPVANNEEEEEEGECNQREEEYDKKDVEEQAAESCEEETEPLVKEELLHGKPAVITEEVQEEEPGTESCEEETGSSTEKEDAVRAAEVLGHDETRGQTKNNEKAGQLATTMMNRLMMMMTMEEKKKGKAFFIYMKQSRSMFLLALAIALPLVLLSFFSAFSQC